MYKFLFVRISILLMELLFDSSSGIHNNKAAAPKRGEIIKGRFTFSFLLCLCLYNTRARLESGAGPH